MHRLPPFPVACILAALSIGLFPAESWGQITVQQLWAKKSPSNVARPIANTTSEMLSVGTNWTASHVYAVGRVAVSATLSQAFLVRFDALTGVPTHEFAWPTPVDGQYAAKGVAVGPRRGILGFYTVYVAVSAPTNHTPIHTNYCILAYEYDPMTGALAPLTGWTNPIIDGHGLDDVPVAIAAGYGTGSQGYVPVAITGYSEVVVDGVLRQNILTAVVNGATGQVVWQTEYDGPDHKDDVPVGLGFGKYDGVVFVGGTSANLLNNDFVTISYPTSNGVENWSRLYDHGGEDTAAGISVIRDEDQPGSGDAVYITGRSEPTGVTGLYEVATIKYLGSGSLGWTPAPGASRYGELPEASCVPSSIKARYTKIEPEGLSQFVIWVGGTVSPVNDNASPDYLALSYVDPGAALPAVTDMTYDRTGGPDEGMVIAMSPPWDFEPTQILNDAWITGLSWGSTGDIATLRFDIEGNMIGQGTPAANHWPQFYSGVLGNPSVPRALQVFYRNHSHNPTIVDVTVGGKAGGASNATSALTINYEETGNP